MELISKAKTKGNTVFIQFWLEPEEHESGFETKKILYKSEMSLPEHQNDIEDYVDHMMEVAEEFIFNNHDICRVCMSNSHMCHECSEDYELHYMMDIDNQGYYHDYN